MAGRYALVEFYGEGKGGSNPDFPSYSEGEVVEDEVSRGPAQWSVLGLGATRPQKFEGQGAHRGVSFVTSDATDLGADFTFAPHARNMRNMRNML